MKDIDDDQMASMPFGPPNLRVIRHVPDELIYDVAARRFFRFGLRRPVLFDTDHAIGNSGIQSNLITVAWPHRVQGHPVFVLLSSGDDQGRPAQPEPGSSLDHPTATAGNGRSVDLDAVHFPRCSQPILQGC